MFIKNSWFANNLNHEFHTVFVTQKKFLLICLIYLQRIRYIFFSIDLHHLVSHFVASSCSANFGCFYFETFNNISLVHIFLMLFSQTLIFCSKIPSCMLKLMYLFISLHSLGLILVTQVSISKLLSIIVQKVLKRKNKE